MINDSQQKFETGDNKAIRERLHLTHHFRTAWKDFVNLPLQNWSQVCTLSNVLIIWACLFQVEKKENCQRHISNQANGQR